MKIDTSKTSHRLLFVLVWTGILFTGYLLTNHFQMFKPSLLPETFIDKVIPFLPWTVIPYLLLILGMYLFVFINHRQDFFTALIALTIAMLLNYVVYTFFPTTFDRPASPESGFALPVYLWLTSIDSPANCLPSNHITTAAVGCWYLMQHRKGSRGPLLILFPLFAMTTLTTKQHYFVDIPSGMATAFIGIILGNLLIKNDSRLRAWLYGFWRE
jgi:hypothetical protein